MASLDVPESCGTADMPDIFFLFKDSPLDLDMGYVCEIDPDEDLLTIWDVDNQSYMEVDIGDFTRYAMFVDSEDEDNFFTLMDSVYGDDEMTTNNLITRVAGAWLKQASKRITVVPAYGRMYSSQQAVQEDWDKGKDFQIQDVSSRWNGSYINKEDAKGGGIQEVVVRYSGGRKSVTIKVSSIAKQAGGSDFEVYIPIPDVSKAFNTAVADAKYEHGHGGYTGSIAEKSGYGYKVITNTPISLSETNSIVRQYIDKNDKWGPAFAFPIADEKIKGVKDYTLTVRARNQMEAQKEATKLLSEKLKGKTFRISLGKVTQSKEGTPIKLKKIPAKGSSLFSVTGMESFVTATNDLKSLYAQMEKALANPKLASHWDQNTVFHVSERKPIASFQVVMGKRLPVWEVKLQAVFPEPNAKIKGWYFFGIASS